MKLFSEMNFTLPLILSIIALTGVQSLTFSGFKLVGDVNDVAPAHYQKKPFVSPGSTVFWSLFVDDGDTKLPQGTHTLTGLWYPPPQQAEQNPEVVFTAQSDQPTDKMVSASDVSVERIDWIHGRFWPFRKNLRPTDSGCYVWTLTLSTGESFSTHTPIHVGPKTKGLRVGQYCSHKRGIPTNSRGPIGDSP